jgi:hypothetical protein
MNMAVITAAPPPSLGRVVASEFGWAAELTDLSWLGRNGFAVC